MIVNYESIKGAFGMVELAERHGGLETLPDVARDFFDIARREREKGRPILERALADVRDLTERSVLKGLEKLRIDRHHGPGGPSVQEFPFVVVLAGVYEYITASEEERQREIEPEILRAVTEALLDKAVKERNKVRDRKGCVGALAELLSGEEAATALKHKEEDARDCEVLNQLILNEIGKSSANTSSTG